MKRQSFAWTLAASLLASAVFAGPAAKRTPVAAGFPDWDGISEKNTASIRGLRSRWITPSDLRHRVVVVVEIDPSDPDKFKKDQLVPLSRVSSLNEHLEGGETAGLAALMLSREVPRKCLVLISFVNKPGKTFDDVFKSTGNVPDPDVAALTRSLCPCYMKAKMVGAPENTENKYPFCYVIDGKSTEPLWKGVLTTKSFAEVRKVVSKAKAGLDSWTPKTGVAEATVHKDVFKMIQDGKYKPAQKKLLVLVKSADTAAATEAQIMYDAVNQYLSDYVMLITQECLSAKPLAYHDLMQLRKIFPGAEKRFASSLAAFSKSAYVPMLADMVGKMMLWQDPAVTLKPAEVKKALAELVKWKKKLKPIIEQKEDISAQGDAMLIDAQLDSLKDVLEAKIVK